MSLPLVHVLLAADERNRAIGLSVLHRRPSAFANALRDRHANYEAAASRWRRRC